MSGLSLRKAGKEDLPVVLGLYAAPDMDDGRVLDLSKAEALFERMCSYPAYGVYLAESEDRAVGTFALLIMDNLGHMGAPSGVVEDVVVDPAWRRRGVGKAMLQYAMQKCRQAGCYKMTLSSNLIRDPAHRFYESLGFSRHSFGFKVDL